MSFTTSPEIVPPNLNHAEVRRLLNKYCYEGEFAHKQYTYGTAGFRYLAHELYPVMVRVGLVAAIRCVQLQDYRSVGVMITASHNDESYNGVKLADAPDGGMMSADGEIMATYVVNERDIEKMWNYIENILKSSSSKNNNNNDGAVGVIHLGRDTREHSPAFSSLVCKVANAMGCTVVDHGVVTTPMLHHTVKHDNSLYLPSLIPSRPNSFGYYELLVQSYAALLSTTDNNNHASSKSHNNNNNNNNNKNPALTRNPTLYVDCACGVGYPHLQHLTQLLQNAGGAATAKQHRKIIAMNPPGSGPLNTECGSEFVQKELRLPHWYSNNNNNNDDNDDGSNNSSVMNKYCAALDGDADRIVFFYMDDNNSLALLDGDKIAALICQFLQQELSVVQAALLSTSSSGTDIPTIKLGVVQTAYANGASTSYLQSIFKNNPQQVVIAKTGVKHVHKAAHDNFDVGVYFEANGHGTILFAPTFYQFIYKAEQQLIPQKDRRALVAMQRLRLLPSLVNQAVGDALSDLLLIDAILQIQQMTVQDFFTNLYTDLPSRQAKVKVKDRSIIQTNDNETRCLAPNGVQDELDRAMQQTENGRAFIRPSGTEDVVRVYAEARTRAQADELANQAIDIIYRFCGGCGDKPFFPTNSRM